MVKVINNIKDVKTRTKKASFGQTMSNIFHKVKTGLRKGADWVRNKAMPWIRNTAMPAIKRGIQKAPEIINRISNTISAATGAAGKIGKIISGKFGRKLEDGSDRAEQKHQEIRQRVENAYKKGEEIVRVGKDAYNQARQK